jgi:hypothetical protein
MRSSLVIKLAYFVMCEVQQKGRKEGRKEGKTNGKNVIKNS